MRRNCKHWLPVLLVLSALNATGQTKTYVNESFRGTTALDWTFVAGQGDGPKLTAAENWDGDGLGWLRLTQNVANQSSFVYYNNPIPTGEGLVFTFDLVIWGSRISLADGLTLAIFDAAVSPAAGGYGGSLGYAQRSGIPGLAGGVVGFGFDVHGNYSAATEGRVGGPGKIANSVAIRGSMGANRNSGYEYLTGTGTLDRFSTPLATSRDAATVHTVRITIPTDRNVSVEWKEEGDLSWTTLIDRFQCGLTCPEEVRFGFTAGTGAVYSNQEIRNLTVTNIPEPGGVLLLGLSAAVVVWVRRRCRTGG